MIAFGVLVVMIIGTKK
ncbi:MAG: hypothetical protein MR347_15645 [[Clostridium] symbiosum]|nr:MULTISPECIES: hypothetical protein [Clostridia]MCD7965029.1 hypothetical protein [Clostridiaceae bacterium]MCD7997645.1 hypothetical protein [Clostridiales bacterium]UWO79640.1 hypothetical protein NQ535_20405 [[Clostridium] asparagiforme DSM 15981]MCG4900081.1 hypothetical protein [Enterocloster bolteae]MCG4900084.1 hypothetical protein [Enterocloster bolteae]